MRIAFALLLSLLFIQPAHAQDPEFDSLKKVLQTTKEDTIKVKAYNRLAHNYLWNEPQKSVQYGLSALKLARKTHFTIAEIDALLRIGEALSVMGNFEKGIEYKLKAYELAQSYGDEEFIGNALLGVSAGYYYQGDYNNCIRYAHKALELSNFSKIGSPVLYGFLGEAFFQLNNLDSSLHYTQKAYELDQKRSWHWSVPYYFLAQIHAKQKHFEMALEYYRLGLGIRPANKDVIDGHLGLANVFYEMNKFDSSLVYARYAINGGRKFSFPSEMMNGATLVKRIYMKQGKNDSAFYYSELAATAKDSLFSQEKLRAVQNLTFAEQLRQQDLEEKKAKDKEERKRNLQYAAIALGLVSFVILYLLFSHTVIANQKLIRFLGLLALLIVFEYINLFIDPYLDGFTHHSPLLMLLVMVCIAAMLGPLHTRLEDWVTKKLVEKNNRIRLAAAKRTIAQLEKKPG